MSKQVSLDAVLAFLTNAKAHGMAQRIAQEFGGEVAPAEPEPTPEPEPVPDEASESGFDFG